MIRAAPRLSTVSAAIGIAFALIATPAFPIPGRTVPTAKFLFHEAQVNVLCQKNIDGRYLLRRVQTAEGCFDEVIDTYDGKVVKRTPAPCEAQCG